MDDPNFPATGTVAEEAPKSLVGLAGESRTGDANGQWARVLTSAGEHTVQVGPNLFAQSYFPILGSNPPKPVTFPTYREDVPCETQEPPDLRSTPGPGEPTIDSGPLSPSVLPRYRRARDRAVRVARQMLREDGLAGRYRVSSREATLHDIQELGE